MMWVFVLAVMMVGYVGWSCVSKKKRPTADGPGRTLGNSQGGEVETTVEDDKNDQKPRVSLYFGSQTGTAAGFAETLMENGDTTLFNIRCVDLEDAEPDEDLPRDAVSVFIMATYGEGDPTDNAVAFHNWLESATELPAGCVESKFAVFGLGDTQYENYNSMGRLFRDRFAELGSTLAYPYGEGDTSAELEEDFEQWAKGFWAGIAASLGLSETPTTHEDDGPTKPTLRLRLKDVPEKVKSPVHEQQLVDKARSAHPQGTSNDAITFGAKNFFHAQTVPVIANRELRKSGQHGSTRHVEIDISSKPDLCYTTADNVSICPRAPDELVRNLAKRMGFSLADVFDLVPAGVGEAKAIFPVPSSVYQALSMYLNIVAVPKRLLLKQMAFFAADSTERAELMMCAGDGYAQIRERHCTIAELLLKFPSINIPLESFVQILPTTQPRQYTISSSSAANPQQIHVTCSVVEHGLCSNYLDRATVYPNQDALSSKVDIFVHESTFRLPADPAVPIIMIGPGTGIAPMRAFLQERQFLMSNGSKLGTAILYFGCRNRDHLQATEGSSTQPTLFEKPSKDPSTQTFLQGHPSTLQNKRQLIQM